MPLLETSQDKGSLPLGLNMQATWRMIAVAFACIGTLATAAIAALIVTFVDANAFPRDLSPAYFSLFMMLGIAIATVSFVVVRMRQPRGAHIDWDAWGVTEYDGDGVRCAILRSRELVHGAQAERCFAQLNSPPRTGPGSASGGGPRRHTGHFANAMALASLPAALTVVALSMSACCNEHPRDLYPQQPETVCQTGVEVGLDIAAWDCMNGERVVAWRTSSALLGCSDVKVERAACGTATAFERSLHEQDLTRCPLLKPQR